MTNRLGRIAAWAAAAVTAGTLGLYLVLMLAGYGIWSPASALWATAMAAAAALAAAGPRADTKAGAMGLLGAAFLLQTGLGVAAIFSIGGLLLLAALLTLVALVVGAASRSRSVSPRPPAERG